MELWQVIIGLFAVAHVIGLAALCRSRLFVPPKQWPNAVYAANPVNASLYIIHAAAFIAFMFITGPYALYTLAVAAPNSDAFVSAYKSYWLWWAAAAVFTVIPLLKLQRSKELLGAAVNLIAGVIANGVQFGNRRMR